jgi:hypothetical protein
METRDHEGGSINHGNNGRHNEGHNSENHGGGGLGPFLAVRLSAIYWRRPNRLDRQSGTVLPISRNGTVREVTLGILSSTR